MRPETPPKNPQAVESLTDPADLLMLVGRFMSACFLFIMTVALLINRQYAIASITGAASLFLQYATTREWRRLRAQREERLAERIARAEQKNDSEASV